MSTYSWLLALSVFALVGCARSPEATRVRGGGPGGDTGNYGRTTELHAGSEMYYRTPCRTVKVKCSGPKAVFGNPGT
jgi:hypothetical protein